MAWRKIQSLCFDMNRDWAWQTQAETKQRMAIYNQWMRHVHSDIHEQDMILLTFSRLQQNLNMNLLKPIKRFSQIIRKKYLRKI